MVSYTTTILKFDKQGEKTGWTYIEVPEEIAGKLKSGNKRSFRVKGFLDKHAISAVSLLPMGGGDFIMPLNAAVRKAIGKRKGAQLKVQLETDDAPIVAPEELTACLEDEPTAMHAFYEMPKSYQNYYIKWIETAKTDVTKAKRIAMTINSLLNGLNFAEMLRAEKANRNMG